MNIAVGAAGGLIGGAIYGYGSQVASNLGQGMNLGQALTTNIDPTKVAVYAGAGALIGATMGVGVEAAQAAVNAYYAAKAVAVGSAAVSAACADGDCTNEIAAGLNAANRATTAVSQASRPLLNATSWQNAEQFLGEYLKLPKNTGHMFAEGMSTYRIPDFVNLTQGYIADSKWVQNLTPTQQIRDLVMLAQNLGVRLDIYVRSGTHWTPEVEELIRSTGGDIIKFFTGP